MEREISPCGRADTLSWSAARQVYAWNAATHCSDGHADAPSDHGGTKRSVDVREPRIAAVMARSKNF